MRYLRTNTAVIITVGPFYDKTDGVTIETGLTITNERITLTADTDNGSAPTNILDNVTGATSGTANDLNYITGNDAGMMQLELAAADVNRVGRMLLSITDAANHCPVFHELMVLPAQVYDSLILGTDLLDANASQAGGTTVTGRDIGASVLLSSGTGTGQISLSSGAVLLQATQTGVTIPTVTTVTNQLTAAAIATGIWQDATAGDFTAASSIGKSLYIANVAPGAAGGHFIAGTNAATSITTALTANITGNLSGSVGSVTGAVGSVTGAVGSVTGAVGSVTGAVGSVAANGITATSIATDAINAAAVKADAVTKIQNGLATPTNITAGTITTATNVTTVNGLAANVITAASMNADASAEISDAVWDEALSGHATAGTAGKALSDASTATGLDAAGVRSAVGLASANLDTQLADLPTNAELASALAAADDAVLAAIAALNNLSAAQVNAEVVDALNVDTYGEPTGAPAATASLVSKIGRNYQALRNKLTVTASAKALFDDAGNALWSKSLTDDGTTYTEAEGS